MPKVKTPIALYVHWPFCLRKCPYCDFNSHVRASIDEDAFSKALLDELDYFARLSPDHVLTSIFFGGGTPSLMPAKTVGALIEKAHEKWAPDGDVEITLEANPSSVEAERFKDFAAAGVNRVSIGVQSLRDDQLKFLGRLHSAKEAIAAVELAQNIFPRVSMDMIYARPHQNVEAWITELDEALAFGLGHYSLYQLTIEEGTAFYLQQQRGELRAADEDSAYDMYVATNERMEAAGLPAYEVSNHAKTGQESRHNLTYWNGGHYVGIGPGAHGRLRLGEKGMVALAQVKKPETWQVQVKGLGHGSNIVKPIKPVDRAYERLMMGLRLTVGVNLDQISKEESVDMRSLIDQGAMTMLVNEGLIEVDGARIKTTFQGRLLLNTVTSQLMGV